MNRLLNGLAKCKELYNQDGVVLIQAEPMYSPMFASKGCLYIWEIIDDTESTDRSPERYLEWKPNYCVEVGTALDENNDEWTVIDSVKKRSRTDSGNMPRDFCNSLINIYISFSDIKSLNCPLNNKQLSLYDGSSELLVTFRFEGLTRDHFIGAMKTFVRLQPTRRSKQLFIVHDANSPEFKELDKTFAALDLKTDNSVWSMLKNIKANPYEKSMEAFAKVTGYVYHSVDNETHYMAQDDLQRSISEIGDDASAYAVYDISCDFPKRIEFPRCNPLSKEQWRAQFNYEGQLEDVESIKNSIFRGGISPEIRKEVWKFLLGYYPWDSTAKERAKRVSDKSDEYYTMKTQWRSFSKTQEDNFSDYSQRKSLIEKDVNRTDRNLSFYAGDNNYNLKTLSDILMTYMLYNFDLGYVQGMSDLLSPILMLLEQEAESFWCFAGFMSKVMSNFDFDQSSMKEQLSSMYLLVNFIDPELSRYFQAHDCANMYFCFRWLLVWFKRELQHEDIVRFWEVLWTGYPCKNFHLLVGVAILEHERESLMGNDNGFTEILKYINELTGKLDMDLMINKAEGIYNQMKEAKHLNDSIRTILGIPIIEEATGAAASNVSTQIYFPNSDSYNQAFEQVPALEAQAPTDLAAVRGTGVYESYVDDIISRGITRLTVEINRLLIGRNGHKENVLFSPLSITSVLALVLLGSNGATFKQISNFWGLQIGIPDIDEKSQIVHEQFGRMIKKLNRTAGFNFGDEVSVASALFVQDGYPIRDIYRNTAQDIYQSSIVNVDFKENPYKAQVLVNNWVAGRTRNKIKNILSEAPTGDTRVILASALYFKAEWEQHFFAGLTKRRPFFVDGRSASTNVEVELMANGGEFPYFKDQELGCEILGLPYKGRKSTMYVVMPFDSSRAKLKEFESKLTEAQLSRLVKQTKQTGVIFLLPRMKIDTTVDLKETLKALGVTSLFDPSRANLALLSPGLRPQATANSSYQSAGLSDRFASFQSIDNIRQVINSESNDNNYQNPGLFASQVIHKVFMDITEKGTEAAAATSVSLSRDGSRVTFRVDVPFSFFIRHDETGMILFWGSIVVPSPSYEVPNSG